MQHNLDIVFLAGLFPKEKEHEILEKSKGAVQSAANALQWNLVDGLDKNNDTPISIINSLFIGAYPQRYKDLLVKTYSFSHNENSKDINVGFVNAFLIKHFFKYITLRPVLKKWAMDKQENKIIIAYALSYINIKCLIFIKHINPQIKTCIVVPDLPEYMNLTNKVSAIYKTLKKIEIRGIYQNIQKIDNYVFLTEQMSTLLKIHNNYTVVEGIYTEHFENSSKMNKIENINNILYTGTLNEKYGVLDLVNAFMLLRSENYRLILCGTGDAEEKIKEIAVMDKRIIFKGQLRREEVLKLQSEATLLINTRKNNEDFTKYSFPSKILEYLSSGIPVVAYKLDGIPDEYDHYIYYIEGDGIEGIANKITEVCEKSKEERIQFGERARKFVAENKNSKVQAEKILKMILSSKK